MCRRGVPARHAAGRSRLCSDWLDQGHVGYDVGRSDHRRDKQGVVVSFGSAVRRWPAEVRPPCKGGRQLGPWGHGGEVFLAFWIFGVVVAPSRQVGLRES